MGLLAQPRVSDMALKPTSPLEGGTQRASQTVGTIFKAYRSEVCLGLPRVLCITVVDVLSHCVVIKQIFKFTPEVRTESVHQARTCIDGVESEQSRAHDSTVQ